MCPADRRAPGVTIYSDVATFPGKPGQTQITKLSRTRAPGDAGQFLRVKTRQGRLCAHRNTPQLHRSSTKPFILKTALHLIDFDAAGFSTGSSLPPPPRGWVGVWEGGREKPPKINRNPIDIKYFEHKNYKCDGFVRDPETSHKPK